MFFWLRQQALSERDGYKGEADVGYAEVQQAHDTAQSRDLAAKVLLGAGGVAVAAGVVLLLLGGDGDEAVAGFRLLPGPAGAVVTWEGEL